mgnify:CR=1 FL=1
MVQQARGDAETSGNVVRDAVAAMSEPIDDELRDALFAKVAQHETRPHKLYVSLPHREILRPQARAFIDFLKGL